MGFAVRQGLALALTARVQGDVGLAEPSCEHGVHGLQQLRASAEVVQQPQALSERGQARVAIPEQADVGVAKPVDRLPLIADREQVLALQCAHQRQLARVDVLQLVHHQQLEPLRPGPSDLLISEQLSREQLEIVEIETVAGPLGGVVALTESDQQLVPQHDRASARLIHGPRLQRTRLVQLGGAQQLRLPARCAPGLGRGQSRRARSAAAQLGVHLQHRRARPVGGVGGDQIDRLRASLRHELAERLRERLSAQPPRETLVKNFVLLGEPRLARVRAQDPCTEPVKRSDERAVDRPRGGRLPQPEQSCPHTLAQLARGALGERDRQDPPGRDPILAHGPDEPLDEHRGLAAPGARGQQQRLGAPPDSVLLLCGQRPRRRSGRGLGRIRGSVAAAAGSANSHPVSRSTITARTGRSLGESTRR